jgi:DNA-binding MarR family transcriptional regulator
MGFKTSWKLYEWISKNGGNSIYGIQKAIGWSKRRIKHNIKRLIKSGIVKRLKGKPSWYYATSLKELLSRWKDNG